MSDDLSEFTKPKTDQLNADDLRGGKTLTFKITSVKLGGGEQPCSIFYEGGEKKPYKPCLSMRRVIVALWGNKIGNYVGKSMTVYCKDDVTYGGDEVGGIRISHMSHIEGDQKVTLAVNKKSRKPWVVQPLVVKETKPIDPAVKEAGDKAASEGSKAYTTWKDSLAPEVKETIRPYHSAWSKQATSVDDKAEMKEGEKKNDNPPI